MEVDERGQRQVLHLPVQLEVGRQLRRDCALQVAPHRRAVEGQFGRQPFQCLVHQVAALLGHLLQAERVCLLVVFWLWDSVFTAVN